MNIRVGKKGGVVHLGLWDRGGTAITRRACRRRNFANAARFRTTTDPVTCKACLRLTEESPAWLVKAAYGNDPTIETLDEGAGVAHPNGVEPAWCARCGGQYAQAAGRYVAAVDGVVCAPCFDRLRGAER